MSHNQKVHIKENEMSMKYNSDEYDLPDFDKFDIYLKEIQHLKEEIVEKCNEHSIPCNLLFCVARHDKRTRLQAGYVVGGNNKDPLIEEVSDLVIDVMSPVTSN